MALSTVFCATSQEKIIKYCKWIFDFAILLNYMQLKGFHVFKSWMYGYLGDKLTRPESKGALCEAIRNYGKCVSGKNLKHGGSSLETVRVLPW
jgi:hypothetical protein